MNDSKTTVFCWVIFILSTWGCASRVTPSGGPKDTTPPFVLSSSPKDSSLHFSGHEIVFNFSEFIQLKDGGRNILFSPPLKYFPEINTLGKKLFIRLTDTLQPNTTYTIFLNRTISDLHEGNEMGEFSLVFSTGNILDDLKVEGNVRDAITGEPVKDVLVMLYPDMADTILGKVKPVKLGRTDSGGNYIIKNIRKGSYFCFALQDLNGNYVFDLPEEKIGYKEGKIKIDSSGKNQYDFRIFQNPSQKFRLIKKEITGSGRISFKYTHPLNRFEVKSMNNKSDKVLYTRFNAGDDSLDVWTSRNETDTIRLFSFASSDEGIAMDTLSFNFKNQFRKGRKPTPKTDSFLKVTLETNSGKIPLGDTLSFSFENPVRKVNNNKIFLTLNSDTFHLNVPVFEENKPLLRFSIPQVKLSDEKHKLILYPGAFEDIYGMINDTLIDYVSSYNSDELGMLDFMIQTKKNTKDFLLELTSKSGKIISTRYIGDGESVLFKNLLPGSYRIKIITDINRNGRWDNGNFEKRIFPENIIFYPDEITIRPGWDSELIWDIPE